MLYREYLDAKVDRMVHVAQEKARKKKDKENLEKKRGLYMKKLTQGFKNMVNLGGLENVGG